MPTISFELFILTSYMHVPVPHPTVNVTINVREVCVFLAPLFSSLTSLVTYALTSELHSTGAGLGERN